MSKQHASTSAFTLQRRNRRIAVVFMVLAAALMVIGFLLILAPVVIGFDEGGSLAALTSDSMVLVWLSLISFAHLLFVPAFCVAVAASDRLRQLRGLPIPPPRSQWPAHESVFGPTRK